MASTRRWGVALAPLVAAAIAAPAQAAPPPAGPQDLLPRLAIAGPFEDAFAGADVRVLGDVDGDGHDDVLVRAFPDTAWVVYGRPGTATVDLADRASADGFAIRLSAPWQRGGDWAAPAGDVDADGLADVLVADAEASTAAVIRGGPRHGDVQLPDLGPTGGFRMTGVELQPPLPVATFSVDGAGDVNGDGYDDVAIGAPGRLNAARDDYDGGVYVVFGGPAPADVDVHALGARGFLVADAPGQFLSHAAGVGDVNGDGLGDLLVGADDTVSDNGGRSASRAHVILGSRSTATVDSGRLGRRGFDVLQGASCCLREGAGFGSVLGPAGDVDGDGLDDLLLSSPHEFERPFTWIVFGSRSTAAVDVYALGRRGLTLLGAPEAAAVGDVDGDGHDDVVALGGGGSALVWGRPASDAGAIVLDDLEGDGLALARGGSAVAGMRGTHRVLLGDAGASPLGRSRAGAALVADLPDPAAGCTVTGTSRADTLRGTPGPDVLCGLGGADTLLGLGADDRLDGGPGRDVLFGGDGADRVVGGPGADRGTGGAGDDLLLGNTGDDLLTGDGGDDHGRGGAGHDTLAGGAGDDELDGGGDGDTVRGHAGDDELRGGRIDDPFDRPSTVDDRPGLLDGGPGDDVLFGGDRERRLLGGHGADRITGSPYGADVVHAGAGPDVVRVEGDAMYVDDFARIANPDDVRCGGGVDEVTFDDGGTVRTRDRPRADCERLLPWP